MIAKTLYVQKFMELMSKAESSITQVLQNAVGAGGSRVREIPTLVNPFSFY